METTRSVVLPNLPQLVGRRPYLGSWMYLQFVARECQRQPRTDITVVTYRSRKVVALGGVGASPLSAESTERVPAHPLRFL